MARFGRLPPSLIPLNFRGQHLQSISKRQGSATTSVYVPAPKALLTVPHSSVTSPTRRPKGRKHKVEEENFKIYSGLTIKSKGKGQFYSHAYVQHKADLT